MRDVQTPYSVSLFGTSTTVKILIDRNIERNAIVYRSAEAPKMVRWGDLDITANVLERQAHLPRKDEAFRKAQLPYLATVGNLAKAGQVRLFASFELQMERMRQRTQGPGYLGLSLLEGVQIENVRSPVGRAVVIGGRNVGAAGGFPRSTSNRCRRAFAKRCRTAFSPAMKIRMTMMF